MKVLHLITTIERGGAENQLLTLVREQTNLGNQVCVVPVKGRPDLEKEFLALGAVVDKSLVGRKFLGQIFLLGKVADGFDVIHAHLPRAEMLVSLSRLRQQTKVIYSKHNTEQFFPKAPKVISSILARCVNSRADSIIAISEAVKTFIGDNHEIRLNSKIDVVHYGYSLPNIPDAVSKQFDQIRKNCDTLIVTAARLAPQKDIPTLLRAFVEIHKGGEAVELVIFGEGPLRQELEELSIQLGITGAVHFLGKSPNVLKAIQLADLFVLTSNYEGFGLVLLEAMCLNTPVIAPRNSAIPEVLGANHELLFQTGNYEELSEKISKLLSDLKLRKSVLAHQASRVKEFSAQKMARAIEEVYQNA
jgi:glycosyltransferase involved in cell wall biosynthesis